MRLLLVRSMDQKGRDLEREPFMKILLAAACAAALAVSAPAGAFSQDAGGMPGAADVARITGGTYKVDPNHTQVAWSVDHMGFSTLFGMFGQPSGKLELDPKNPKAAKLEVEFPMTGLTVTSEKFLNHLKSDEFLDAAKFPTATFRSTSVEPVGQKAKVTGDLTVHGVTKPVTLDVAFHGAGINPMSKVETVGFSGTTNIKRSDFGLGAFVPVVSDDVTITVVGAFEK